MACTNSEKVTWVNEKVRISWANTEAECGQYMKEASYIYLPKSLLNHLTVAPPKCVMLCYLRMRNYSMVQRLVLQSKSLVNCAKPYARFHYLRDD